MLKFLSINFQQNLSKALKESLVQIAPLAPLGGPNTKKYQLTLNFGTSVFTKFLSAICFEMQYI